MASRRVRGGSYCALEMAKAPACIQKALHYASYKTKPEESSGHYRGPGDERRVILAWRNTPPSPRILAAPRGRANPCDRLLATAPNPCEARIRRDALRLREARRDALRMRVRCPVARIVAQGKSPSGPMQIVKSPWTRHPLQLRGASERNVNDGRARYRCNDCAGTGMCQHGRQKLRCTACGTTTHMPAWNRAIVLPAVRQHALLHTRTGTAPLQRMRGKLILPTRQAEDTMPPMRTAARLPARQEERQARRRVPTGSANARTGSITRHNETRRNATRRRVPTTKRAARRNPQKRNEAPRTHNETRGTAKPAETQRGAAYPQRNARHGEPRRNATRRRVPTTKRAARRNPQKRNEAPRTHNETRGTAKPAETQRGAAYPQRNAPATKRNARDTREATAHPARNAGTARGGAQKRGAATARDGASWGGSPSDRGGDRGARTHDHKVKGLALCRLS